jgi:hypothetical protein
MHIGVYGRGALAFARPSALSANAPHDHNFTF